MITTWPRITHEHAQHGLKHYHDEEMQSVAVAIDGDVDPEKFLPWLNEYVQKEGASILRSKGILAFKNEPKRFVFQGVHMILDGDVQRDWRPGETRRAASYSSAATLRKTRSAWDFSPARREPTRRMAVFLKTYAGESARQT